MDLKGNTIVSDLKVGPNIVDFANSAVFNNSFYCFCTVVDINPAPKLVAFQIVCQLVWNFLLFLNC